MEAKKTEDEVYKDWAPLSPSFIIVAKISLKTFKELINTGSNLAYIAPFLMRSSIELKQKYNIEVSHYAYDSNIDSGSVPLVIDPIVSYGKAKLEVIYKRG